MRFLVPILLTVALTGCAQAQEPLVTEMPSAQVDAPQSANSSDAEADAGQETEGNDSAESAAEPSQDASAKPEQEQQSDASPSPTPTKTTEPAPTKTPEPSPSPTKSLSGYTMAQVAQKNSQSACWVAIDGMVYDLTDWIREHPGGRGAILSLCGTDGTSSFNAQHGGRSGPSAALDRYVLGPLSN